MINKSELKNTIEIGNKFAKSDFTNNELGAKWTYQIAKFKNDLPKDLQFMVSNISTHGATKEINRANNNVVLVGLKDILRKKVNNNKCYDFLFTFFYSAIYVSHPLQ